MDPLSTQWDLDERIPPQFQQTVNTLMETLIKPDRLKRDLFFALLLILMKENNFRLLKENQHVTTLVDYITTFKDEDAYEAKFVLDDFDETPVKIIATPLANVLLVNTLVTDVNCDVFSLGLSIDKYIKEAKCGSPILSDLNELVFLVKDHIITPVTNTIRNHHNYICNNICCLPENVIIDILMKLPVRDILNASEASKRINGIVRDDHTWRKLCERELYTHKSGDDSWYAFYIKSHLKKEEEFKNNVFDKVPYPTYDYELDMIL